MKAKTKLWDVLAVTSLKVTPVEERHGKTLAFAEVCLNEQIMLTRLRVIDGANGLFVSYPIDPARVDAYRSIFYPLTKELRESIEEAVLEAYDEALSKGRRKRKI
jgi:stage V sporulation protein G